MASEDMEVAAPAQALSEERAALEEGKRLLAEEQIPAAILEFRKAVGIDPDLHEAWYRLGEAYVKFEDWDNAADAFAKCGDFDLRGTCDYVTKIAKAAGVSARDLMNEMPQDFSPVLDEVKRMEEEIARRTREAQELARQEEAKRRLAEAAKEADDPPEPLPDDMSPFLTNSFAPGLVSVVSFAIWGFGCFVAGHLAGGIARLSIQLVALYLYLKETGVSTAAVTWIRANVHGNLADFCATHFPAAAAGQVSWAIKNANFLHSRLTPGEAANIWSVADSFAWPLLLGAFCLGCLAAAGNSAITAWYLNSKIYLSGFVSELRNQDVWVNFGDDHYVELGDRYRVYKRTRYLKTVKAEGTVTTVEARKCILEVRINADPETKKPYEIQVGDVVRK